MTTKLPSTHEIQTLLGLFMVNAALFFVFFLNNQSLYNNITNEHSVCLKCNDSEVHIHYCKWCKMLLSFLGDVA